MFLQTGYPGGLSSPANPINWTDATASCDVQLGNDVLPFHQPITLPSGCVIDLFRSQIPTTWYQQQSVLPNSIPTGWVKCAPDPQNAGQFIVRLYSPQMDVMFSPRGNVTGSVSALGAMFFLLRDMRDATVTDPTTGASGLDPTLLVNQSRLQGDMLILGVFPQTGLVQTFDVDLTDNVNNQTGAAGSDGITDNLFNFAQKGQSAGR
jgi:hypothetical protein